MVFTAKRQTTEIDAIIYFYIVVDLSSRDSPRSNSEPNLEIGTFPHYSRDNDMSRVLVFRCSISSMSYSEEINEGIGSFLFINRSFFLCFLDRLPPAAGSSRKRGGLRDGDGLSTSSSSRAGDGNRRSDRRLSISSRILKGDRARREASRQRQDEPGDVAGSGAVRRAAGEEGAPREQLVLLLRSSARRRPPLQSSQLQRATW